MFRTNETIWQNMVEYINWEYNARGDTGAEQDFLSVYFGHYCTFCDKHFECHLRTCPWCWSSPEEPNSIGTLPTKYNLQVHQLGLTGIAAHPDSPLGEAILDAEHGDTRIIHFSGHPKPIGVICGTLERCNETVHNPKNQAVRTQDGRN